MSTEKQIGLLKRNAVELVNIEEAAGLLSKKNRSAYYGIAPTGKFHIGYLVPTLKTIDLDKLGFKQTILFADLHAYLDDLKTPWEKQEARTNYYRACVEKLPFAKKIGFKYKVGSEFQLEKDYYQDLLKSLPMVTVSRATRAASEVCRMKNPKVSELVYPLMQCLDCAYLEADLALGGIDQRHIYMLGREILPQLGYEKPVCLFTPLITSLKGPGVKISASIPGSGFLVHDSEEKIKKAVLDAHCPVGETQNNPVLQLARFVLFPVYEKLKIARPEKFGGDVEFTEYSELEKAFGEKKLHPLDLKKTLSEMFSEFLKPVREFFDSNKDLLENL